MIIERTVYTLECEGCGEWYKHYLDDMEWYLGVVEENAEKDGWTVFTNYSHWCPDCKVDE